MSEENVNNEGEVNEEEVREATAMGWSDKDKWRGRPEDWVDAKTFLERGRTIMPMLQKNNERLLGQVTSLTGQVTTLMEQLKAADASIKTLEQTAEEDVKAQVEAARKELRDEIARASREGDHDAVADATVKLTELNTAAAGGADDDKSKGKVKTDDNTTTRVQVPPEVTAWYAANPEYKTNPRKVALSQAVAYELRSDPANNALVGVAFLEKVAEEVEKTLGESPKRGSSKVSGGNGGTGNGGRGAGGVKTYADLPAEAKAACDRQAARLVGPNRAHKDVNSWRASYTKQYFGE